MELSSQAEVQEGHVQQVFLHVSLHVSGQVLSRDLLSAADTAELTCHQLQGTLCRQMPLQITAFHRSRFTSVGAGLGKFRTLGQMLICSNIVGSSKVAVLTPPWSFGAHVGMLIKTAQIAHPLTPTSLVRAANFKAVHNSFEILVGVRRKIRLLAHGAGLPLPLQSGTGCYRNVVATAGGLMGVSQDFKGYGTKHVLRRLFNEIILNFRRLGLLSNSCV